MAAVPAEPGLRLEHDPDPGLSPHRADLPEQDHPVRVAGKARASRHSVTASVVIHRLRQTRLPGS